jgi:hypothetical protein
MLPWKLMLGHCNGSTCKDKWGTIYGNFKNIHDHMNGYGLDEEYWNMNLKHKIDLGLP